MLCNTGQEPVSCPDGWHSYLSNCYYVSENAAEWDDARSECQSMNSDLVSITDQDEQNFVHSIS